MEFLVGLWAACRQTHGRYITGQDVSTIVAFGTFGGFLSLLLPSELPESPQFGGNRRGIGKRRRKLSFRQQIYDDLFPARGPLLRSLHEFIHVGSVGPEHVYVGEHILYGQRAEYIIRLC